MWHFLGGCLNHVYIRAHKYTKFQTARLNGIVFFYHYSDSRAEKNTVALLVLYVCILKGVMAFRKLVQCLAEKKNTYFLRPALQCAEDGET